MKTPISKDSFIQINIVVEDIEKAAEKWAAIFGIEKPVVQERHLEGNPDYVYRGQMISGDLKVADIPMNGWVLELHQPTGGDSTFREYFEKHGNGVHHLGFEVGDRRDAVIEALKEEGFDTDRTFGGYPGSSWTIVDAEDILGVNLNIKPVR